MSAKSSRMVIRLDPELHDWLDARAQAEGLDLAPYIRRLLHLHRAGQDSVALERAAYLAPNQPAAPPATPESHEAILAEPDIDHIVAQQLQEVERTGIPHRAPDPPAMNGQGFNDGFGPPIRALHQVKRAAGKDWMAR